MKPAILVPYKNRESHLAIFLKCVPAYLELVNDIQDYVVYVAEQTSSDVFNLALSRNIAAMFALDERRGFDYFVMHDVDVIPIQNIDYRSQPHNIVWFMTAGSCKVLLNDFQRANGYNPKFVGWGDEDADFYHRLTFLGCELVEWHKSEESKCAVMCDLERPQMSHKEATALSKRYFGYTDEGPRFIGHNGTFAGLNIKRYDKSRDFLLPEYRLKNKELRSYLYRMPSDQKAHYIAANGLNLINLSGIRVKQRTSKLVWLTYETSSVF